MRTAVGFILDGRAELLLTQDHASNEEKGTGRKGCAASTLALVGATAFFGDLGVAHDISGMLATASSTKHGAHKHSHCQASLVLHCETPIVTLIEVQ